MNAKEFFDAGNLSAAIDQLNQDVKTNPTDSRSRIFLFELLCFSGAYERAQRQLETIIHLSGDASVEIGGQLYKNIVEAEQARQRIFTKGGQPKFLHEPPPYTTLHLDALARLLENRPGEAKALLEESSDSRPPLKGRIDGRSFEEFRDCDDLIAPFLEVFVQTDYVWLAFEHIRRIEIAPPTKLRDLIWVPARIELHRGSLGETFLPTLYPGSSEHPNDLVKLGRMTDWKPVGEDLVLGVGQRMFLIDDEDRPILEIKEVEYEPGS